MNIRLVVIDAQEDFTRGALYNHDAIKALPTIRNIVDYANKNRFSIFYTADTHDKDYMKTQRGKNLPMEHCIYNSPGWAICPEVAHGNNPIIITKNSFGTVEWEDWDLTIGSANEIYVCGFCTDICVISNVLILKALYPEVPITVFENACAGVTPEKHAAALEVMKSCQINVERWDE